MAYSAGGSIMTHTIVGVDIAKNVMQVHWVDPETGEIVNRPVKRAAFLEYFANRSPCLIGNGILQRIPTLGAAIDRDGPPGEADASEIRQGIQHPQQKRCCRCSSNLDGYADGQQGSCREDRGSTGSARAASHAAATGEVPHDADQQPARIADRVWRGDGCRSSCVGQIRRWGFGKIVGTPASDTDRNVYASNGKVWMTSIGRSARSSAVCMSG